MVFICRSKFLLKFKLHGSDVRTTVAILPAKTVHLSKTGLLTIDLWKCNCEAINMPLKSHLMALASLYRPFA